MGQLTPAEIEIAERVRQACLAAASEAYDTAKLSGLCEEGAWECALDAVRSLDLKAALTAPWPTVR